MYNSILESVALTRLPPSYAVFLCRVVLGFLLMLLLLTSILLLLVLLINMMFEIVVDSLTIVQGLVYKRKRFDELLYFRRMYWVQIFNIEEERIYVWHVSRLMFCKHEPVAERTSLIFGLLLTQSLLRNSPVT